MVQAVPLSVKLAGAVLVPVKVPLKPNVVLPVPAARVRFQSRFVAVMPAPVRVHVALQPGGVSCCPDGKENARVQPLIAVVPVLVRVMLAVNPLEPGPQFDAL